MALPMAKGLDDLEGLRVRLQRLAVSPSLLSTARGG